MKTQSAKQTRCSYFEGREEIEWIRKLSNKEALILIPC